MSAIAFFGREFKKEYNEAVQFVVDRLEAEHYKIIVHEEFYERIKEYVHFTDLPATFGHDDTLCSDTKCLFSFGGDGTMLDTVHIVKDSKIPVLGFNFGRLGFLSIVNISKIRDILNLFLTGKYHLEERTLLKVSCDYFDKENYSLNEVCVTRKEPYSMLAMEVWIDGLYLNKYWGDGLIIATPTGSTAYSLSCGGPILHPATKSFVVTPIASHNLTVGSIVVPDNCTIDVKVVCRDPEFYVNMDSYNQKLQSGCMFTVQKNDFNFVLVIPENENFYKTIREKLNWGLDVRN